MNRRARAELWRAYSLVLDKIKNRLNAKLVDGSPLTSIPDDVSVAILYENGVVCPLPRLGKPHLHCISVCIGLGATASFPISLMPRTLVPVPPHCLCHDIYPCVC